MYHLNCAIAMNNGRVSLSDDFLTITDGSSKRKIRIISNENVKQKLRAHFAVRQVDTMEALYFILSECIRLAFLFKLNIANSKIKITRYALWQSLNLRILCRLPDPNYQDVRRHFGPPWPRLCVRDFLTKHQLNSV